jgi:hypothetical protein
MRKLCLYWKTYIIIMNRRINPKYAKCPYTIFASRRLFFYPLTRRSVEVVGMIFRAFLFFYLFCCVNQTHLINESRLSKYGDRYMFINSQKTVAHRWVGDKRGVLDQVVVFPFCDGRRVLG